MLHNIAQFIDISNKKFLSYPGNIKNMSSRKTLKLLRRKQAFQLFQCINHICFAARAYKNGYIACRRSKISFRIGFTD